MDSMEFIDYTVIKQETTGYDDLYKFDPLLGDFKDYIPFIDKKIAFRVAAISYHTVDPNGKPVEASGLVFHPINRKSRGVIDFLPTAHMDSEGGGTDELYAIEGILMIVV